MFILFLVQQSKAVAFAIRTNVSFDASYDDHSPVPGYGLSFGIREFIHIKEVCASLVFTVTVSIQSEQMFSKQILTTTATEIQQ